MKFLWREETRGYDEVQILPVVRGGKKNGRSSLWIKSGPGPQYGLHTKMTEHYLTVTWKLGVTRTSLAARGHSITLPLKPPPNLTIRLRTYWA